MPVVVLGVVLGYELNADVQQRSLQTARTSATVIAQVGIQPLLNAGQMTGGMSPAEVAEVDRKLQGAAVSDEVERIKVWNRSGAVIYSDNHSLIGKTFPIDDDLEKALAGQASASISSGHDAENAGDYLNGPVIQVYVPLVFSGTTTPSGAFELYLPYAPVQAAINNESRQLFILLAAGLTLFYASMFPVVLIAERWRRRLIHEAESTALANLAVLERLNNLKSEFLIRISHQFRTALVGIEGFSELIRESDRLDLDEVKSFATDIYQDAERLDKAFGEMLELDRMETGRTVLALARADINQVVTRVVDDARKRNPGRVVTATLAPSLPSIRCDEARIAQLTAILVDNAIRYSRSSGDIVVSTKADAKHVEVSIADHGPGMPPDFDQSLFVSGTGLGLPIARQIADMHGGRIWYESTQGDGTVFHFTLPVQSRPSRSMRAVPRIAYPAPPEPRQPPLPIR